MIFARRAAVLVLSAAALVLSGCDSPPVEAAPPALKSDKDRRPAPDFTLKDSNGATVHISDYRGKVVLLDFWATWCGPCKIEIPWFMEFEQQYRNRGFSVVGISMDEDGWEVVKPYVQERKMNYRVLLGDDHVGSLYGGVEALPTTFLIDRQGRIAAIHVGLSSSKDGFRNEIEQLLAAPRGNDHRASADRLRSGAGAEQRPVGG